MGHITEGKRKSSSVPRSSLRLSKRVSRSLKRATWKVRRKKSNKVKFSQMGPLLGKSSTSLKPLKKGRSNISPCEPLTDSKPKAGSQLDSPCLTTAYAVALELAKPESYLLHQDMERQQLLSVWQAQASLLNEKFYILPSNLEEKS